MPQLDMPPFRMPAPGTAGKALLDSFPQGDVIDCILLKLTGTTFDPSHIEALAVKIGGKDAVACSGTELQKINYYNGVPQDDAYLPIWFADPEAHARQQWSEGALDTANRTYSDIQIEVELDGNQSNDAGLEAQRLIGQQKVGPKDQIEQLRDMFRILTESEQDMETGRQPFKLNLGTTAGATINRIHFFHSNMTKFEAKREGANLVDNLPIADMEFVQKHHRTPQAGMFTYDPAYMGFHSRGIPTLEGDRPANFRWVPTMSAGETMRAVTDAFSTIARI